LACIYVFRPAGRQDPRVCWESPISRASHPQTQAWYNEWDRYMQQQIQTALLKKSSPRDALTASANKARELKKQWS